MLLPRPESFVRGDGAFRLTVATAIAAPTELARTAAWLQGALRPATGLPLATGVIGETGGTIELSLDEALGAEAYRLSVDPTVVRIAGRDPAGVFYGCQSLLQLLPPEIFRRATVSGVEWSIPAVTLQDSPRFTWRGVMLDVARHFLPKHDVLRFIDLMAMHKLNVLHFHLTDDQGWRIEIRAYPRLTEISSWRKESQVGAGAERPGDGRPHGGFYTQDDIREIVAYAAERHITVVPEIEMPGHVQAVLAAYPEFGVTGKPIDVGTRWGIIEDVANAEDRTVQFFCDVLDEVAELFPSRFVHVGGDECPREQWAADPRTQQLMRERGITREADVQTWFMARIGEHLSRLAKRMVGWDEILEGTIPDGSVISSWRGMQGAITAARKGYDVVSCPTDYVYLDFRQSDGPDEPIPVAIPLTLERAYEFEPVPAELSPEQAAHVLGAQANIWTEYMDSARIVDFFAFPRLCAVAEALWTTGERRFPEFADRLTEHLKRLDAVGVEYRHLSGPEPWQMRPGIPGRPTSMEAWLQLTAELVADIRDE
ncbi:MAG: beta-N-acetylhexosaminidase [Actinobacteria bacterium]|nr:beta-N-acetylhexosaminidase [Actinomycetota bacterium]